MKKFQKMLIVSFLALFLVPAFTFAHQPRIVESRQNIVPNPEISKAYYATLAGEPDVYIINADTAFDLYVNILVPDIAGQKKDVSVEILKDGDKSPLATLAGQPSDWKKFYEPFGADTYWMGPEYKARAEAGTYEIRVSSPNNDTKYSLAIGELEKFDSKEGMNALISIPQIKMHFFNKSFFSIFKSPFIYGPSLVLVVVIILVIFIIRRIKHRK
ncbi:MAG: hypothetical protein NTZ44_02735 [Candidatus Nomurabacteria bacterium]|nr:hypothetical protein [Candidatus Nomurabacteria bacterium]